MHEGRVLRIRKWWVVVEVVMVMAVMLLVVGMGNVLASRYGGFVVAGGKAPQGRRVVMFMVRFHAGRLWLEEYAWGLLYTG
jgi:hypothetical protein